MLRDDDVRRSFAYRLKFPRKIGAAIAAICCVAASFAPSAGGAQILLEPMTSGTYSWDWIGPPANKGAGFNARAFMTAGGYQKQAITRSYRSYMTFDTFDSESSILSATLDLTVKKRTTVTPTSPFSRLDLYLGLPGRFTAEEIADLQYAYHTPTGFDIFADLANNEFSSISIPFGDVIQPTVIEDILISTPLPLSFIAAFNQARSSGRYLTVSISGGEYGYFSVDFSIRSRLLVNNLTPVPEPTGWVCLSLGLGAIAIGRTLRAAKRAETVSAHTPAGE